MRLLAVLLKHRGAPLLRGNGTGATVHRPPFRYCNFSGNVVADARMKA